jgi:hypothetical protein
MTLPKIEWKGRFGFEIQFKAPNYMNGFEIVISVLVELYMSKYLFKLTYYKST